VVYVPYYNPYVVYGTWWWPAYRPVYWRPWVARPVFVTRVVQPVRVIHAPVRVVQQPVRVLRPVQVTTPYHRVPESQRMPIIHSGPAVTRPVMQERRLHIAQEARRAQIAPVQRSMPAPHARATERPAHNFQGHGFGQGSRNGGGRHKS